MHPSLRPALLAGVLLAIGIYGFQFDPDQKFAYSLSIGLGLFILIKMFQAKAEAKKKNKNKTKPDLSRAYKKNIHFKNQQGKSLNQKRESKHLPPAKVIDLNEYRKKNTPEHPKAGWVCIYKSMDRTQCLLIKSILESEGILTRANNLQVTSFLPVMDNLTLEILVPKVEEEAALAIINAQASPENDRTDQNNQDQ